MTDTGWIDIIDKKPAFGMIVLIQMDSKVVTIGFRREVSDGTKWTIFNGFYGNMVYEEDYPQYWRPMPEPK
jgi:hypothetical protein